MHLQKYIALLGINFHNPSWDAFIFLVWIAVALIYSFSAGRGRIIAILVAVYMSELVVIQAPFLSSTVAAKAGLAIYFGRLITFSVLFGFFFLVLSKYVFRTSVENHSFGAWFFSVIFSFLQVGFLINVVLSFLPPEIKASFVPSVQRIFLSNTASFVWLVLPILYLVLAGRLIAGREEL